MANGYVYLLRGYARADSPSSWSLVISVVFIVIFSGVSWFASPKGENQTYVQRYRHMRYIVPSLRTPPGAGVKTKYSC